MINIKQKYIKSCSESFAQSPIVIGECDTDYDNRILMLSGDVEVMTVDHLIRQIIEINDYDDSMEDTYKNHERNPIRLYINSWGGGAHEVLGLINVIKASRTPVITICTGFAMSAGALLLACGHIRLAYPFSTIMFHEAIMDLGRDSFSSLKNDVDFYEKFHDRIHHIWIEHTNMAPEDLKEKITGKNWYMDATEALEAGIIDHIVEFHNVNSIISSTTADSRRKSGESQTTTQDE